MEIALTTQKRTNEQIKWVAWVFLAQVAFLGTTLLPSGISQDFISSVWQISMGVEPPVSQEYISVRPTPTIVVGLPITILI